MLNNVKTNTAQLTNSFRIRNKPNILIIDPYKNIISILSLVISSEGCNIIHVVDSEVDLGKIKGIKLDLVFSEIMMKSKSSLELFTLIRKQNKDVPIIIVTSYEELISVKDAKMFEEDELLLKPLNLQRVRSVIRNYCN